VQIRTRFFANYRDLLGLSELGVELPTGATVRDAVEAVRSRGGAFSALPEDPAVAVNHEYAGASVTLRDGDEVAFIPPVAGG